MRSGARTSSSSSRRAIAVGRDMRVSRPTMAAAVREGAADGGAERARRRDGRHGDGLFRGRRARARRRDRRDRVAQPEGVHRHEDRPARRAAGRRRVWAARRARPRARGAVAATPSAARSATRTSGSGSSIGCCRSSTSTRCGRLRVVIDAANGMAGAMLPPVLERLPMLDVVRCYFEPDGTFPNHEPNPLLPENREFIIAQDDERGRGLRRRVRRRRRPLLLRRRRGRVRPGRLHDRAVRRVDPREGAGRQGDLRRARVVGRAGGDRAGGRRCRSSTASGTRSSSSACARRTPSSAARCRRTTTSAISSQADSGSMPFLLMCDLISQRGKLSELLAPFREPLLHHRRDQHTGRRRPVEARRSWRRASAPRGGSRISTASRSSVRRLALQRPPVEHRAAAPPEPRSALRGADGPAPGRGARRHPRVAGHPRIGAWHRTWWPWTRLRGTWVTAGVRPPHGGG